tara:strand:- start:130 stop:396 length:267 start_codon:yes stop_codon:yes gene_type:complete
MSLTAEQLKQLQQLQAPEHLGDGVYVKYDGFHIAISVNDHNNEPAVYLEDSVMDELARFAVRKRRELEQLVYLAPDIGEEDSALKDLR